MNLSTNPAGIYHYNSCALSQYNQSVYPPCPSITVSFILVNLLSGLPWKLQMTITGSLGWKGAAKLALAVPFSDDFIDHSQVIIVQMEAEFQL